MKRNNGLIPKLVCALSLSLAAALPAAAQFYHAGDDPGRTRWMSTDTPDFRIIYPVGMDSLAREYGKALEKWRIPVGQSIHYLPGQYTRGPVPVILHPFNSYSNGSVAWAPRRMDLYTVPSVYSPEPMSWMTMLAIHESRHVAQMQFGLSYALRPFGWFFGEMICGGASGLYGHNSFLEGDAVCAETALTPSGRGRSADFLNYYRIAFDCGDTRSLYKWSHDSQTRFVPDKYALGYLLTGGIRCFYDVPDYTGQFYEHAARRPYDFKYSTVTRKLCGTNLNGAFEHIRDTITVIWRAEMEARRPYTPMKQVTPTKRGYEQYSALAVEGDRILARRKSLYRTTDLVSIGPDGKVRHIRNAASYTGPISVSADSTGSRIYWSETLSSGRWSLSNTSAIRWSKGSHRRDRTLVKRERLYNPVPSPSGRTIAAVDYCDSGYFSVRLLDREGRTMDRMRAPSGLQLSELVWTSEDSLIVLGIDDRGCGLYRVPLEGCGLYRVASEGGDGWTPILGPVAASIRSLSVDGKGRVIFTSDRSGVNEMYSISPDGSSVRQETSTRYGASDFRYDPSGEWVYCIAQRLEGDFVFRAAADSLLGREVDFSVLHSYTIADKLSEQEKAYGCTPTAPDSVSFSEPKRYRKIAHLFNVHSWAPFYFNADNIMDMSYDRYYELASLGAAALVQNRLGTFTGGFGWSVHKDPDEKSLWRHSAHAHFKYTGWLPVIEAKLDFNDRRARDYGPLKLNTEICRKGNKIYTAKWAALPGYRSERPYVHGHVAVSIPLSWTAGGIHYGLTPALSFDISNDRYDTGVASWTSNVSELGKTGVFRSFEYIRGRSFPSMYSTASVRGYAMLSTAPSAIYPRFGIGAEIGCVKHYGLKVEPPVDKVFRLPVIYAYAYGYLPGILPEQGLRLTARGQKALGNMGLFNSGAISTTPRGMRRSGVPQVLAGQSWSASFTADYAVPITLGDLSIGKGFLDFRRLVLTPHFDGSFSPLGMLLSTGASLTVDFSGILWHTLYLSAGATVSYNGGSAYQGIEKAGTPIGRVFAGPLFSFNF